LLWWRWRQCEWKRNGGTVQHEHALRTPSTGYTRPLIAHRSSWPRDTALPDEYSNPLGRWHIPPLNSITVAISRTVAPTTMPCGLATKTQQLLTNLLRPPYDLRSFLHHPTISLVIVHRSWDNVSHDPTTLTTVISSNLRNTWNHLVWRHIPV